MFFDLAWSNHLNEGHPCRAMGGGREEGVICSDWSLLRAQLNKLITLNLNMETIVYSCLHDLNNQKYNSI